MTKLWYDCIKCFKYDDQRDIAVALGLCTRAGVCSMKRSVHKWWMSGICRTFKKLSSLLQIWCSTRGTGCDSGTGWEYIVVNWTSTRITSTSTTTNRIHWCQECWTRKVNGTDNSATRVLSGWSARCSCSNGTTGVGNILKCNELRFWCGVTYHW